jgi:hypothetical protein
VCRFRRRFGMQDRCRQLRWRACKQASMFCVMPCHPASLNRLHEGKGEESIACPCKRPHRDLRAARLCTRTPGDKGRRRFFLSNRSLSRFENPLPLRESVDILCRMPRHLSRRSMSHVEVPDPCRALGCDSACSISHTLPFCCQHDSMRMMLLDNSEVAGQML